VTLARFTRLRARSEKRRDTRKVVAPHRREMRATDRERDSARHAERLAEVYGAEYGQHYLRELVWKAYGCQLCDLYHPPAVLHHTKTKARLGKAEDQVVLGRACHDKGHNKGWLALEHQHGKDLRAIAALNAAAGTEAGYLPLELCVLCGEWHSKKLMLDQIREDSSPVRICQWCAGEGPP
jgi:hypothetical protein